MIMDLIKKILGNGVEDYSEERTTVIEMNSDLKMEDIQQTAINEVSLLSEEMMREKRSKISVDTEEDLISDEKIVNTKRTKLNEIYNGYCFCDKEKVGFRKKELEHSFKEYAEEGTTFWKFSQSKKGIAGESGVYAEYIPGKSVESKDKENMLSFVRDEDLYKCWMYGDQITEFVFDKRDEKFEAISSNMAYETGNTFGEIKTDFLLVKENYSLSNIKNVKKIIDLSGNNKKDAVRTFFIVPLFKKQMEKYGFCEVMDFIDYVNERSPENPVEGAAWISQNIDELYADYINENGK